MPSTSLLASVCAASGLLLASCGGLQRAADRATLARQDDGYVRTVLALGVRDPDSLDFYAGPDSWLHQARAALEPFSDVRSRALALAVDLERTRSSWPETLSRRAFLKQQLDAVIARVDLLTGRRFTFDEESRQLFGVDPGQRDYARFAEIRREVDRLLPGSGTIAERARALEQQFIVPADRLPAVISRAMTECRRLTLANLHLPSNEHVEVEYVRRMPWPAFTRYEGRQRSRTQINLDFAFSIDRALDVACHETYPGHHTINVLLDPRIQPLFSPQSLRTEGAATYAPALAFPLEARLAFERDVLMPMAHLESHDADRYVRVAARVDALRWLQADIARRYLDGRLEFARAVIALEEETLMSPAASEPLLKFFNEFRTYVVAYTVGRDLARDQVEAVPDGPARWHAYERWFGP